MGLLNKRLSLLQSNQVSRLPSTPTLRATCIKTNILNKNLIANQASMEMLQLVSWAQTENNTQCKLWVMAGLEATNLAHIFQKKVPGKIVRIMLNKTFHILKLATIRCLIFRTNFWEACQKVRGMNLEVKKLPWMIIPSNFWFFQASKNWMTHQVMWSAVALNKTSAFLATSSKWKSVKITRPQIETATVNPSSILSQKTHQQPASETSTTTWLKQVLSAAFTTTSSPSECGKRTTNRLLLRRLDKQWQTSYLALEALILAAKALASRVTSISLFH